jgi:hypothetical protein
MTAEQGQNNLAFAALLQLGDATACTDLLLKTHREPEAALFARTYAPRSTSSLLPLRPLLTSLHTAKPRRPSMPGNRRSRLRASQRSRTRSRHPRRARICSRRGGRRRSSGRRRWRRGRMERGRRQRTTRRARRSRLASGWVGVCRLGGCPKIAMFSFHLLCS